MIATPVMDETRKQLRDRVRTLPGDGDAPARAGRLRMRPMDRPIYNPALPNGGQQ